MDPVQDYLTAIRGAAAAGNYAEAVALKFWQLLERVQTHLDAAGLEIRETPGASGTRPNLTALITDASATVDAELAAQGDAFNHDVQAASLILRSLANLLNHVESSASLDEAARLLLLGFDIGVADTISGFLDAGRYDNDASLQELREKQSLGGKRHPDWWESAMRRYAAIQEMANPPGSLSQKVALSFAVETDELKWSNPSRRSELEEQSDHDELKKRMASLKKAIARQPDFYSRVLADVRAAATECGQTPGGLQPFLVQLVKAAPK
jgi:hypothetical protein